MSRKIMGVTVGTPTSLNKIKDEIKPVQTVNGVSPDENGNVNISGGAAPAYTYGTADIEAGTASPYPEGTLHFIYEPAG